MGKWKLELTRDMETYWSSWNIEIGGQPVLSEGVPMHVAETPGEGLYAPFSPSCETVASLCPACNARAGTGEC